MYKLTERRLKKAEPILEKHREFLRRNGEVGTLERELRECWRVGYQELKDIFIQLSKITRYRHLAAFYMEHSAHGCVVSGFKSTLAKLYGITSRKGFDDAPERERKRRAFWQEFKTLKGRGNGHDTDPAMPR